MNSFKTILTIGLSLFLLGMTHQVLAQDESLEDILEAHYEAIGQDALNEVNSITFKGKMMMQTMEMPMSRFQQRPNKIRQQGTFQGTTFIMCYNGESGWMVAPWTGSADAQPMPDEQVDDMKQEADMDGFLYNYEEKGHTVTLEGMEEVEGTEAYKIKVVTNKEDEIFFYLDVDSYMVLKTTSTMMREGKEMTSETFFSNYKMIDGIAVAHSLTVSGAQGQQEIIVEELTFNEEYEEDFFEMPEAEEDEEDDEEDDDDDGDDDDGNN